MTVTTERRCRGKRKERERSKNYDEKNLMFNEGQLTHQHNMLFICLFA